MPDLNAPRYAIPCLDAQDVLTGRTLVCPDRKRIVATECVPVYPGPCGCWEGTYPDGVNTRWLMTIEGIVLCEGCWNYYDGSGARRSNEVEWHSGPHAGNGSFLMFHGGTCQWFTGDGWQNPYIGSFWLRIWSDWNCGGYLLEENLQEVRGSMAIGYSWPYDAMTVIATVGDLNFAGRVVLPAPRDCHQPIVIPNTNPNYGCFSGTNPWYIRSAFEGQVTVRVVEV